MNSTTQLLSLSMTPFIRAIRRWWQERLEDHYLMSAATEAQRSKEALANQSYYQKRAAIARSAARDLR